MGALGMFLGLSKQQERAFLEKVRKFADEADPEKIKSEFEEMKIQFKEIHDAVLVNNELLNTIILYLKMEDAERLKKARAEAKRIADEKRMGPTERKRTWGRSNWS
jgi:hypothetical protein